MPNYRAYWVMANYNTFTYKDPTKNLHLQFCYKIFFSKNLPNSKPKHFIYILAKMTYRTFGTLHKRKVDPTLHKFHDRNKSCKSARKNHIQNTDTRHTLGN